MSWDFVIFIMCARAVTAMRLDGLEASLPIFSYPPLSCDLLVMLDYLIFDVFDAEYSEFLAQIEKLLQPSCSWADYYLQFPF
mmetsp:Transcript_9186/g.14556  ORF Transcript_9186/g.14556 Transcript_9186/m.14556 type:complete len:82 (-) Transcript_9186:58-303(-)